MIETYVIFIMIVAIGIFMCNALKGVGNALTSSKEKRPTIPAFRYDRNEQKKARKRHRDYARWRKKDPEKWNLYKQFLRDSDFSYEEAKARGEDMNEFWEKERIRRDEFYRKIRGAE